MPFLALAADALFRLAANTAADRWWHRPAYVTYVADATVDIPTLRRHETVSRAVEARTFDDVAAVQDLPHGRRQYTHAWPLIPAFDAISYFHVDYNGNPHNPLSAVRVDQPITFTDPAAHPGADVVVTTLRNYYARYADDSNDRIAHIVMNPLPALTRGNDSTYYLHDVFVDTATNLPTRVTYRGTDADFDVDYGVYDGHWMVNHAVYRGTVHGPLRIGRVTFTVDSRFSNFAFPEHAADPKIADGNFKP